jgi:hypothetical protein
MADEIDTDIDGKQLAKLSHGEFVIPADVVSHLGNGNSSAGADVLYKMMERVRKARTGNPKQGKRINPDKFTPGGGVGGGYAGGGIIAFAGPDGSLVPTTGQGASTSLPVSSESNLSAYVGPYVTDMLSKGQALANTPYQAYTGQLTAGSSPLQDQAFSTAGGLSTPGGFGQGKDMLTSAGTGLGSINYNPNTFTTGTFDSSAAQQYMNPYMQMSLDPQIAEARRQSQISNMGSQAKLAQAGAFGGSRDAIMRSEADRNLGTNLAGITGTGYNNAFNSAMQQFNADQGRQLQAQQGTEQSRQFGANLGLQGLQGQASAGSALGNLGTQENQAGLANLNTQLGVGAMQRGIESEGVAADLAQFNKEQQYPYQQLQFQQGLLSGLPVGTNTVATGSSPMGQTAKSFSDLQAMLKQLGIGG